jgi:hypothetical protein
LIAGSAGKITGEQIRQMASIASRLLADIPPPTVTVGKILYHPEAIMLATRPAEALVPALHAVQDATREVTGSPGRSGNKLQSWTPHITIAYSTERQPAGPIIAALGRSLPERKIQLSAVTVVTQRGPERSWDWQPNATIRFGTAQ